MKYALVLMNSIVGGGTQSPLELNPTVIAVGSTAAAMDALGNALNAAFSEAAVTGVPALGGQVSIVAGTVPVNGNPVVGATITAETGVYTPITA